MCKWVQIVWTSELPSLNGMAPPCPIHSFAYNNHCMFQQVCWQACQSMILKLHCFPLRHGFGFLVNCITSIYSYMWVHSFNQAAWDVILLYINCLTAAQTHPNFQRPSDQTVQAGNDVCGGVGPLGCKLPRREAEVGMWHGLGCWEQAHVRNHSCNVNGSVFFLTKTG